jgi:indolepyruvate ferredoxin oxidoreductase, beta subunit
MAETRKRITIAVLALGGQGGGVLSDWLIAVAEQNGWYAQATSVQGVAQRTGSTVYYLELFPEEERSKGDPVLALMPAPGDVDVVVASELMEAGRAILRGFVTPDRTTLIASTHRIYAIAEKSAVSGGVGDGSKVMEAAAKNAKAVVMFDMDTASERNGAAISAVMLGAIAASGTLPFPREAFETAIRDSRIAVDANLAGFTAGFEGRDADKAPVAPIDVVQEGVRRLTEYQDADYAALYLERLKTFADPQVRAEMARGLALWMSYEDVMRVAQLKIRRARMDEVREEVKAAPGQIVHVSEYMHPRWEEVCDTLSARLGAWLLGNTTLKRLFAPFFAKGRRVRTTNVGWFLMLRMLARRRRSRRSTLRYKTENARIEAWLATVAHESDPAAAIELARAQNLIKGYGDTHARGLAKFEALMEAYRRIAGTPDAASTLRRLREAALRDEDGIALERALQSQ